MNLYTQGVDPKLKVDRVSDIVRIYEECTRMKVHERHPYTGELVYTAFSGSHQDAIKKGLDEYKEKKPLYWEVPYLTVNPADIGREYEPIIRINSQSGKGGIAFIIESEYNYKLPKKMHLEIGKLVQKVTDEIGKELEPKEIFEIFKNAYINIDELLSLNFFESTIVDKFSKDENKVTVVAEVSYRGNNTRIKGNGNGPIDAFFNGLEVLEIDSFELVDYEEHIMNTGVDAEAVAYIGLRDKNKQVKYGIGRDCNTGIASIKALIGAINRHIV